MCISLDSAEYLWAKKMGGAANMPWKANQAGKTQFCGRLMTTCNPTKHGSRSVLICFFDTDIV
jgi:hypothetical protein